MSKYDLFLTNENNHTHRDTITNKLPSLIIGVHVGGAWWLSPSAHRCSSTHLNRREAGLPWGRASLQIKKPWKKRSALAWCEPSFHPWRAEARRGEFWALALSNLAEGHHVLFYLTKQDEAAAQKYKWLYNADLQDLAVPILMMELLLARFLLLLHITAQQTQWWAHYTTHIGSCQMDFGVIICKNMICIIKNAINNGELDESLV